MMIFDQFPSRKQAEAFAAYVKAEFRKDAQVFDSQKESNKVDIFPFQLFPPIVLVERYDDEDDDWMTKARKEEKIHKLVEQFEGTFAGT